MLARHLQLRFAPEVQFRLDEDFELAERVDAILERIKLEKEGALDPSVAPYFKTKPRQ